MRFSKPVIFIETGGRSEEEISKVIHEAAVKLARALKMYAKEEEERKARSLKRKKRSKDKAGEALAEEEKK